MKILEKISMLKILKWLAKFGGHILLYHLIVRFVFGYKTLHYKVEEGYYLEHIHIKKEHKVYPIEYKEDDKNMKSWERDLKCCGFIEKVILAKGDKKHCKNL